MTEADNDTVAKNAMQKRISNYVDAQLARLLEQVIDAITQYQHGAVGARDTNRMIENYCDAEQMLSRWADRSRLEDHVAFLDGAGAQTFDWWGAPERERSNHLNKAVADRESRERERTDVRWPWSKVQRSDSSKG